MIEVIGILPSNVPGASMGWFHRQCLLYFHSPCMGSKLRMLLQESDPYEVAMSAIMAKTVEGNSELASMHALDRTSSESLDQAHRATKLDFPNVVEEARTNPCDRTFAHMKSYLAEGCLNIRACLEHKNPTVALEEHANDLLKYIEALENDVEAMYIGNVDQAFSAMSQLLGHRLLTRQMSRGMLSRLMPTFVNRLTTRLASALDFWNDIAKSFRQDGPVRDSTPRYLRDLIDEHLSQYRQTGQVAPSMEVLSCMDPDNAEQYRACDRTMALAPHSFAVRMLHSPSDLYWVAPCMLLFSHWRPFIGHLLGGHPRSLTPSSVVYDLTAYPVSLSTPKQAPDSSDSDE